jgi:hypothetical protein
MTAPDAARPAESVKDVLLHALLRDEFGRHYDEIMAGPSGESWREGDMKAKARRLAAALAEAGIGSLAQARAEAWDEGYAACVDDGISTDSPNPYTARAAAQQPATPQEPTDD